MTNLFKAHHSAKLIAKTVPVGFEAITSPEELVVYAARISNPENQMNTETAPRLLRYLVKHKHWSPFEQVDLSFEITTTRDISRQILRHRSLSFQEYSGRYSQMDSNMVRRECRLQDLKNRQNSVAVTDSEDDIVDDWNFTQEQSWESATGYYQWALEKGVAKEQARALLPEGLTKTTLIVKGSLRSWIHYVEVRAAPETQAEHRWVAESIKESLVKEFPNVAEALAW